MDFAIKGDIAYSASRSELCTVENGTLVCTDGICRGVFRELPEQYSSLRCFDFSGMLVIPGMVDLHLHAPQYAFRGLHMDEQLLPWLEKYAFPEEMKYENLVYAQRAYAIFADRLRLSATTRAAVFASRHLPATLLLMELLEKTGLHTFVGKVNMDRGAPDALMDASAEASARETEELIEKASRFQNTKTIVTPRFIPSCTDALMEKLGEIVKRFNVPVQSHLSENPEELALVQSLMPDVAFYGAGYEKYGLLGETKTIMAHCVYSPDEEMELLRRKGVFIAHCPSSNLNIGSGFAPIRRYLEAGLRIGLGSDVAGGESESIFGELRKAIVVSKMYTRYVNPKAKPLTFPEAFWLATRSGGAFFGRVGAFDEGFDADIVVLEDAKHPHPQKLTVAERLERSVYLGADRDVIAAKFVAGKRIL